MGGGMVSAGLRADQQQHVRERQVRERERQPAVDPERAVDAAAADDMQQRPL